MANQPSFKSSLKDLQEVILPLILPSTETFTTPLLDNFAVAHDPLMENNALFAGKTDLGGIHVELDATLRLLARLSKDEEQKTKSSQAMKDASTDVKHLLDTTKQARLRSNLRSMTGAGHARESAGSPSVEPTAATEASILRASRQRREKFDKEIAEEENKALDEFKRQLREAVLQTSA